MDVLNLIKDYISCSQYMCSSLKHNYNIKEEPLLRARKSGLIPKQGALPDEIIFNFHGIGCYFEFENGEIDIDFGPNGRCDGFDFFRLKDFFLITKHSAYGLLDTESLLKAEYQKIIEQGLIYNPKWDPGVDLYYLTPLQNEM